MPHINMWGISICLTQIQSVLVCAIRLKLSPSGQPSYFDPGGRFPVIRKYSTICP